jgi:alkylated DNA repair dioxygenase AlkB
MDELLRGMLIDLINGDIVSLEAKSILYTKQHKLMINSMFDLFEPKSVIKNAFDIPGLYYIKDYLTEPETKLIMNKINSEIKFEPISNSPNSRMVAHFGYYYSYDRSGLKPAIAIPDYLAKLVDANRINSLCCDIIDSPFDQLIINEYKPNQQISPHTDHVKQFGPVIACITVGKSIPLNFKSGSIIKTINIETGSMYIMSGPARYKWLHSLKNSSSETRYSLTYRTIIK